jgi:hypothetical protein
MTETGEVDRERGSPRASAGDYKIHPAGLTTKAAEYTKKQSGAATLSRILVLRLMRLLAAIPSLGHETAQESQKSAASGFPRS